MGILSHGFGRFIDLTDVPSSYVGSAGKYLKVNTTASGIEFTSTTGNIFNTIEFNTSYVPTGNEPTGSLFWNTDRETLDLVMPNGIDLQIGQDLQFFIKNQSGVTINKGEAVMFDGALGASGIIKGKKAIADGTYPPEYMMGIANETIIDGANGKVQFFGEIAGIDTSGYSAGDLLWINPSVPGGLTTTKPTDPNVQFLMAAVLDSKNNGNIMVRAIPPDYQTSFERTNKNLKSYPATLAYSGSGDLSTITYTVPGGTIVKTFNYTAGNLTSIVLSGNTPSGISLTKTLTYTTGNLTGVSYS